MAALSLSDNQKSFLKKLSWTLFVIAATAIITTMINDYRTRARPYIELVRIDLDRPPSENLRIFPSVEIINLEANSGIGIEKFTGLHSISKWNRIIEMVEQHTDLFPYAIRVITEIIEELKVISLDTERRKEEARIELMQEFSAVPYSMLEKFTKSILEREGYLIKIRHNKEYAKYLEHPEEWQSPLRGRVYYASNRYFNLWELKCDDEKEEHKTFIQNVYRRIWINMDKDFMIEIFTHVLKELEERLPVTQALVCSMKQQLDEVNPTHLHCTVALSNIGKKAAIFAGNGLLKINKAGETLKIPIGAFLEKRAFNAFTLSGESSMLVDFYSCDSVEKIEATLLPNLESAYRNKTMYCNISLFRLSKKMDYEEVELNQQKVFGPN